MSFLDKFLSPFLKVLRQPVESFIRLETADDEYTLVAKDGSLVSLIRIDGCRQLAGEQEYQRIIEQATVKLGSRFDRPGHALQVYFMRDPERVSGPLSRLMEPLYQTIDNMELDLHDLLSEREKNLRRYLAWEDMYFVLWTRASALTKTELERAIKEAKQRKWVVAREAQHPLITLDPLRTRHKSFVTGIQASLKDMDIQAQPVDAHEALRSIRVSLYPSRAHRQWKACLPGDPIPPRYSEDKADLSDILWPSLASQLILTDAEVLSTTVVQMDDLIWSGVDLSLAPMEPTSFQKLLQRLAESKVPFRVSFLIESGGIGTASLRRGVASILAITEPINKQIRDSIKMLDDLSRREPVVKLRVSFATWAPKDEPGLLENRVALLVQAVESWGYCQVSLNAGDPLQAVMSSALGIACASTAPAAIAPLKEVVKLLPWQRPSSPFKEGPTLFRSTNGRIWPYQTGSSLTTTWFDLIFAQPGAGKSVLLNTLNLSTCLTRGLSRLPYIAIIDIGPSSAGLISLLKDALPPQRRHEVVHHRLRMLPEYSINPFDTQLGCRYPLPDERSYLVELLTLLATSPGQDKPYDGIPQLAGLVVDEMFRWRDDQGSASEPQPYLSNIDQDVDESLKKHRVKLPDESYWWDVVEALYAAGDTHAAGLAQRHAAPTLTDAITAARRPQIRDLLEETTIGAGSENVLNAFERMITSAIREYPILSTITRFDLGEARVCALDLADVAPQGDDTANRQTAIMYMLARHAMVRHWWLNEDSLPNIPEAFRPYHEIRLRDIRGTAKRLCFDEFHRTSNSRAVRSQIIRDVREGRKWGVQIALSSQLLDDFDQDMVNLATGVWILGSAISDRAVDDAVKCFGLTETARWVMRNRLTGPRKSGGPLLLVLGTNEGRYEQFLINTLGPLELWALSTSSNDMLIRSQLYTKLGASTARKILASFYPGGTAGDDIEHRMTQMTEDTTSKNILKSKVIEDIIHEMVEAAAKLNLAPPEDS